MAGEASWRVQKQVVVQAKHLGFATAVTVSLNFRALIITQFRFYFSGVQLHLSSVKKEQQPTIEERIM